MQSKRFGLILFALFVLLAGACSKEHGELLNGFPLPRISEARLTGPESVQLRWSVQDAASVEEYRLYVGIYANLGYAALDTMTLAAATDADSYVYVDTALDSISEEYCDQAQLCDSLYRYTYFRVSAVRGGFEGVPGPRVFPGW